jgi:hypothetical protein
MRAFSPKSLWPGRRHRGWLGVAIIAFLWAAMAQAQDLQQYPTPFSVWLDFRALAAPDPLKLSLPIWFESLTSNSTPASDGVPEKTVFRLLFRDIGGVNSQLLLRLFFDDIQNSGPTVTGWSETGTSSFQRGPLGDGLGLPTSEKLILPMTGVNYIEVSVTGDGSSVRGAFLALMKQAPGSHPIDYPPLSTVGDAFDNLPASAPNPADSNLFGRVKATIDPGTMKLSPGPEASGSWHFELQSQPLLAVVTFEILDVEVTAPPEIIVNNQPLGPATVHMPDLADPAYLGRVRALDSNMHFRYTGWLRAQKVIPASALQAGLNTVVVQLNKDSGPVAVRTVELQLKYNSPTLDYSISASTP